VLTSLEHFLWRVIFFHLNRLGQSDLLRKLLEWVTSLKFFKLNARVLVEELVNAHVAAANPHLELVLSESHLHALRSKLVDASLLAKEHDFEFVAVREVVHEVGKADVHRIVLNRDVHLHLRFQVHAVDFEGVDFFGLVANLVE